MTLEAIYREALAHILHMAQDDEGGDMISGIERRASTALDGRSIADEEARRRAERSRDIDLSGRPA